MLTCCKQNTWKFEGTFHKNLELVAHNSLILLRGVAQDAQTLTIVSAISTLQPPPRTKWQGFKTSRCPAA